MSFVDAAVQALPVQDIDFDLHHVQPAGEFWRVVALKQLERPACFRRGEGIVERPCRMDREVVDHHADRGGARRARQPPPRARSEFFNTNALLAAKQRYPRPHNWHGALQLAVPIEGGRQRMASIR
jgi:hypothetical protein